MSTLFWIGVTGFVVTAIANSWARRRMAHRIDAWDDDPFADLKVAFSPVGLFATWGFALQFVWVFVILTALSD